MGITNDSYMCFITRSTPTIASLYLLPRDFAGIVVACCDGLGNLVYYIGDNYLFGYCDFSSSRICNSILCKLGACAAWPFKSPKGFEL